MNIAEEETIKKFNYRYRRYYHNLNREYQKLITVKEYQEAISSRIFPCSQVALARVTDLQEAYRIAELAEKTENEIKEKNENNGPRARQGLKNISMFTQNNNYMMGHPFYRVFINEEVSYPMYNGFNRMNNTGNRRNLNSNPSRYNNRSFATNFKENYDVRRNYIGNPYNNNNNNFKRVFHKELKREDQIIPNNSAEKKVSGDPEKEEGTNGTVRRSFPPSCCHRCGEKRHKAQDCQYTYKQLAEIEEKGLLNC